MDFVSPEDVQTIAPDALRHRLLLDYGAQARGVTAQGCVEELLRRRVHVGPDLRRCALLVVNARLCMYI